MAGKQRVARRHFLQRIAVAATGTAVLPMLVRASALGRGGSVAPSQRVTLGVVSTGAAALLSSVRQFQRHPDAQVVALGSAGELAWRPDIDALLISAACRVAPDIAATAANKDIFCAAPESLTIAEGRRLARAVAAGNRIFQADYAGRFLATYRRLVASVRQGQIGRLEKIAIAAPDGVCAARVLDVAQWANDTETLGPVEVESRAKGGLHVAYRYAKGVVIELRRGPAAIRFTGTSGWIASQGWGGPVQASTPSILDRSLAVDVPWAETRPGGPYRNFLDCVKSRRACEVPAEVAQRSATLANLGGMALRLGRLLQWNPYAENFIDDAQADALRSSRASVWIG